MKKFVAFLIIVGLALPVVAQISPYLEKGKGGFGLTGGFEQGGSFKGYFGTLSGSFKGIIDLDVYVGTDHYDKIAASLLGDNGSSLGFVGTATWWAIRKQPSSMVNLDFGLTAGYENYAYSKYSYIHNTDGNTVDYKGYMGGLVGFESRIKFRMNESWSLIPGYAVVYGFGKDKGVENGVAYADPYSDFMSRFGVSLAKRLAKGNVVFFAANQYFGTSESSSFYELTVGFILSQK